MDRVPSSAHGAPPRVWALLIGAVFVLCLVQAIVLLGAGYSANAPPDESSAAAATARGDEGVR